MINREVAPSSHPVAGFQIIRPVHIELSNGIHLHLINGGSQELTRIEWIFKNDYSQNESALLNTVACGMLLEGTSSYAHREITDTIDFYGAYLMPEFSHDHSSLKLFSLNKHVPKLLPILKSILTESVFPERELNTFLRNAKQRLQVSLEKNDFTARREFGRAIFGKNRYGISSEREDYDGITRAELVNLYQRQFTSQNCTIIVSGNIDDAFIRLLREYFEDSWSPNETGTIKDNFPVATSEQGQRVYIERPKALQSALRLGIRTIRRSHADFPALQFLNVLLGGYFGSRLMTNIREDKGYTYGVGSGIVSLKHDSYLTIATEVATDVTRATLNEIEYEINRLRTEPISVEELELVKNYILGSMLGELENVFAHGDKVKNVHFSGLDIGYYDYYIKTISNMRSETVMSMANTYLDFSKMTTVIVGKDL